LNFFLLTMSTGIPESVSTATTTTTTVTHASSDLSQREPREALDTLNGPSFGDRASAAAKSAAASLSSVAHIVGIKTAAAAHTVSDKVNETAHEIDAKYHLGDKARDAASHVGAALKSGNPIHAVKHAGTAATIGEAERLKHEQGPIPENAHSAEAGVGNVTNATASSVTSSSSTGSSIGQKVSDSAAFTSAAISAGNPGFAAKNATTAAVIGSAEAQKHAAGNLENEKDIYSVTHS